MNRYATIFQMISIVLFSSCKSNLFDKKEAVENIPFTENFNNLELFHQNWKDNSFGHPKSYQLENDALKVSTRPNSKDRVKVKTKRKDFGLGTYEWKIYIPKFNINDQCSIGAFIYHSGKTPYEIDFEIGSGNIKDRKEIKAKTNEAIVHCTSQHHPHTSDVFKVTTEQWHYFKMELSENNNRYFIKWFINNVLVKTLQTDIKTKHKFTVHNSLENLSFMGEHLPTKENYALFDSFNFK
ncbi:hypothetical protein QVZ41_07125 [Wenyingzhuangia sp. chi5]|uniref:GH16 domain-containing protein n=1 Tax=Wenyingzhuangia gilva TaxID=3057677 RepID=A0ABT8VRN1_9FLAO|nr:hypothetical protein [Wenyingzhuangia sp. chi5]MDO3694615.1 hypothetical protein [Wenyingzhuangia sp. chi5]